MAYPRVASLKTAEAFAVRLDEVGVSLPFSESVAANGPLAESLETSAGRVGNRFCVLPMEGWDGTADGRPSELTERRWRNFGRSGAKLIWGGEAVAVRQDGRANPNQLVMTDANAADIAGLRESLVAAHRDAFGIGAEDDLVVGLQLTHSGRFARPDDGPRPRVAYRHPLLDPKFDVRGDEAVLSDDELQALRDDFVVAAGRAASAGFDFVDVKHCHGYLGHELLSGYDRPGRYGGTIENRTRFLREVVDGIRAEAPGLEIGVRVSVFDFVPFAKGEGDVGGPMGVDEPYRYAFGGDGSGTGIDLAEPREFLRQCESLGVRLICATAGSPYYVPHVTRPALFPPSDGYLPPEDPLVGVARQVSVTAELKRDFPELTLVGSGYSYLQEWLPNVADAAVGSGMVDSVGLGRMVLSYPELPADVFAGTFPKRKKVCRTFSDCTSAPRNGMVSGCFPLDPFYKGREEAGRVKELRNNPA
ncbi:MAG: NADH:flavin oxidoreductase [Planctomycetota bacterium]